MNGNCSICLFLTDFPEKIEDSFYHGKVSIIFEASSPSHHDAKMSKLIDHRPIMFFIEMVNQITDLYNLVQMYLIPLFCKLNLNHL